MIGTAPLALSDPVTCDWTGEALRRAGVLHRGTVDAVAETRNPAFNSSVVHLRVTYSADAAPDAPTHLLLKRNDRGWGEREVAFYRAVGANSELPVVRCHDAAFAAESGNSHLLFDDVSPLYEEAVTRADLLTGNAVPPPRRLAAVMTALGRFHAFWWEHEGIGRVEPFLVRPWFSDRDAFGAHVERRQREWSAFVGVPGSDVPSDVDAFYVDALARLPVLWDAIGPRVESGRALTVSHGDCYLTQFLCTLDDADARIVDFDSVSGNFGAFDLVYLLPTFWTPEQRAAHEIEALRLYHEALGAHGVDDYSWADLEDDYRLMLSLMVFDPVFDQTNGSSREYWWPKMQNLIAAHRDWH